METVRDFIFLGSKITADGDCSHEIKRHLLLVKKAIDKPRLHIQKQRHHFVDKSPYTQSYGSSNSRVPMWMVYQCSEGWAWNNWCLWTVVLEEALEIPLDSKVMKPGNHTWREALTHWKRPWCWERLRAGGEGVDRGQDGGMASPTQWTWVWANFGR